MSTKSIELLEAVVKNDYEAVQKHVDGLDFNVDHVYENGYTALHVAVKKNRAEITRLLLQRGADVDFRDSRGQSCFHMAAHAGSLDSLKLLFERADGSGHVDNVRRTPLYAAVFSGHCEVARFLLAAAGCDMNAATMSGRTALHAAVQSENRSMIQLLLAHGADPNRMGASCDGCTPFQAFVQYCPDDVDLFRVFLEHGARLPLNRGESWNALTSAACYSPFEMFRELLQMKVMDVNHRDEHSGCALMHYAAKSSRFSTVARAGHEAAVDKMRLLVSLGAEINPTGGGETVLHLLLQEENLEGLYYLRGLGAVATGPGYNRYVFKAIREGDAKLLQLLTDLGKKLDICDDVGRSPLHAAILSDAADKDRLDVVELLLSRGVDAVDEEALLAAVRAHRNSHLLRLLLCIHDPDDLSLSLHETLMSEAMACANSKAMQYLLMYTDSVNLENNVRFPREFVIYYYASRIIESDDCIEMMTTHKTLMAWDPELPVDGKNSDFVPSDDLLRTMAELREEIERMRSTRVHRDHSVTYYDLLTKRHGALTQCLSIRDVAQQLCTAESYASFEHLREDLAFNVLRGQCRLRKMLRFRSVLDEIFGAVLPALVVDEIAKYFNKKFHSTCILK